MNETNCENILMAKMAEFDGEKAEISAEIMNSHLSICESCRSEIGQLQNVGDLLNKQTRRKSNPDLWSVIEQQISVKKSLSFIPFIFLGVFLVIYKLLEMLPEQSFGLAFKIVPLIIIVALFVFIKENPFKINTELTLERKCYDQ
jgi:ABC-type methionine transport system permease subunit